MTIYLLINMKKPVIVGIFISISRENFIEHEKCFKPRGLDTHGSFSVFFFKGDKIL